MTATTDQTLDPAIAADGPPGGLLRRMLDPRSLQALMGAGGGLLALGLVIWLAVIGAFDEPLHAALALGLGNSLLLALGVWVAAATRYRAAGRGLAMLACLLLPLNLWFYDAQGLITLDRGGHLWAPALVCCLVYAGVARVLKDSAFVYAFAGGVAMTGLLFLADAQVARFYEVLSPATLLVTLGVVGIAARRFFPVTAPEPAFTRGDFGLAFFRAGNVLLTAGLAVLAAGRVAGRLYDPLFAGNVWFARPEVSDALAAQLAAIALALVGVGAYAYGRVVTGNKGYTGAAAMAACWATLMGCDLAGLELRGTLLAITTLGTVATILGRQIDRPNLAHAGRLTLIVTGAAGVFLGGTRFLAGEADGALLATVVTQLALTAVGAAFTRPEEGRRGLFAVISGQLVVAAVVIRAISTLHPLQQLEALSLAVGLAMVVAGLVNWRRETLAGDHLNAGATDAQLWAGSLLATAPLAVGLLAARLGGGRTLVGLDPRGRRARRGPRPPRGRPGLPPEGDHADRRRAAHGLCVRPGGAVAGAGATAERGRLPHGRGRPGVRRRGCRERVA